MFLPTIVMPARFGPMRSWIIALWRRSAQTSTGAKVRTMTSTSTISRDRRDRAATASIRPCASCRGRGRRQRARAASASRRERRASLPSSLAERGRAPPRPAARPPAREPRARKRCADALGVDERALGLGVASRPAPRTCATLGQRAVVARERRRVGTLAQRRERGRVLRAGPAERDHAVDRARRRRRAAASASARQRRGPRPAARPRGSGCCRRCAGSSSPSQPPSAAR